MTGWVTEALECIGIFFYAVLIIRIWLSRDSYFNTPFFTFFITTGVCGIFSVFTFMAGTILNLTVHWAWVFKMCWIVNHVGAIGSILGKLIISFNRYSVLRSSDLAENKWSRPLIYRLVVLQFLIPCTSSVKILFFDYKYEMRNGVEVAYTFTDSWIVVYD